MRPIRRATVSLRGKTAAVHRIHALEHEAQEILHSMRCLVDEFKQTMTAPRPLYLSIQKVRSGTVYVRWRRKGVEGDQKYLHFSYPQGHEFLACLTPQVCNVYLHYNRLALDLTLAHSIRTNEIRRLRQYIRDLDGIDFE